MPDNKLPQFIAYNPDVDGFGRAVRRMRGETKATKVARRALGADASKNAVRNFANYIQRIEREEAALTNPTLDVLERLATGFGYERPSQFLERIEALQSGAKGAHKGTTEDSSPPSEGNDADYRPISAATLRAAGRALIEAGGALAGLSVGVETTSPADTIQPAHPKKSSGGKRGP